METITETNNGQLEEEAVVQDLHLNTQNEVDEILGNPPGWMQRWGILLIFLIVAMGLGASYMIRYPDIIEAPVQLTTNQPPIVVVNQQEGKIRQLLVQDQQRVAKGELLALIDGPSQYEDIEALEIFMQEVSGKMSDWSNFMEIAIPEGLELGELNPASAGLIQSVRDFQYFLGRSGVFERIRSLDREIGKIHKLNESLRRQEKLYLEELQLVQNNYTRNQQLLQEKLISEVAFEQVESTYLQARRQHETLRSGIINNELRIEQLSTQKNSLKVDRADGLSQRELDVLQRIDQLQASIDDWKYRYLVRAPIEGVIQMKDFRAAEQFVPRGAAIFTLIPEGHQRQQIIARCQVPSWGSGKISEGAKANIRLDGFPYREYGVLQTQIDKIASLPITEAGASPSYEMEMILPDSLETTYNHRIPFKHQMNGKVHIITEDRSILGRIFEQITSAIKN